MKWLAIAMVVAWSLTAYPAAAAPVRPPVPVEALPSAQFDAQRATDAWLAQVPVPDRARSDAYFEGGYWLVLWDFLWPAAVMLLLLETRFSARMRDIAQRVSRSAWLHDFLYWLQFAIATAVLTFPLTAYEGFFREHRYGLSNQSFGSWLRDQLIGLAVSLVFGGVAVAAIVAVVRRLRRSWHLWGALVSFVFVVLSVAISPVFIAPLFNKYTPLPESALKRSILSLAHANGIPVDNVYESDASRQSKRVSANVSGMLGTDRITLNDNLLARCSPEAVLSVMGHEMGHYVLHHIFNAMVFTALVLLAVFWILRWAVERALARCGERWQVEGVSDIAVLPLAALILLTVGFLLTPLTNSYTRTQEFEADIFGLNAARQPDGEAEADLLLGEYRKLDPSPLEEFLFYDHPGGRTRIYAAMRWKAENLCLFDARLPCKSASAANSLKSLPSAGSSLNER